MRDRTADLLRARQALSQLSYSPFACLFRAARRHLLSSRTGVRFLSRILDQPKKSCAKPSINLSAMPIRDLRLSG